ncbi:MAG TPA: hypothetical protein VHD82_11255 [Amycolatopsis sp.]|nr:hypothetical protein [Amycolatopsis sp.]HVV09822.1 hypothetical protein [Amycolatopsis sp.]
MSNTRALGCRAAPDCRFSPIANSLQPDREQSFDHRVAQFTGEPVGFLQPDQLLGLLRGEVDFGAGAHPHGLHSAPQLGQFGRPGGVHRRLQLPVGDPAHLFDQPGERGGERTAQDQDRRRAEQQRECRARDRDRAGGGLCTGRGLQPGRGQIADPGLQRRRPRAQHVETLFAVGQICREVHRIGRAGAGFGDLRCRGTVQPLGERRVDFVQQAERNRLSGQQRAKCLCLPGGIRFAFDVRLEEFFVPGEQKTAFARFHVHVAFAQRGDRLLGRPEHHPHVRADVAGVQPRQRRRRRCDEHQHQQRTDKQIDPPSQGAWPELAEHGSA